MGKMHRSKNILDLPREVTGVEPKITITGFDELLIENYKGIQEYEEFYMRINTHIGAININGFELTVGQLTEDDILIKGVIESIDIERITE